MGELLSAKISAWVMLSVTNRSWHARHHFYLIWICVRFFIVIIRALILQHGHGLKTQYSCCQLLQSKYYHNNHFGLKGSWDWWFGLEPASTLTSCHHIPRFSIWSNTRSPSAIERENADNQNIWPKGGSSETLERGTIGRKSCSNTLYGWVGTPTRRQLL